MAVSRTVWWVAGGLLARLLMLAVLIVSIRFILANYTKTKYGPYQDNVNQLQSYKYAVASGIMGLAGTLALLQVPVGIYLLCKSSKMTASTLLLDISMYADMVITPVLASGVGAGFGATNDALRYVRMIRWEDMGSGVPLSESDARLRRSDLKAYYSRESVGIAFLLVGMVLSMCATVVSARLRARANDHEQP